MTEDSSNVSRQTSDIRHTLVDNKLVDHSDVVGAVPILDLNLAPMDWVKETARGDENHISFGNWSDLNYRFYGRFWLHGIYVPWHPKKTGRLNQSFNHSLALTTELSDFCSEYFWGNWVLKTGLAILFQAMIIPWSYLISLVCLYKQKAFNVIILIGRELSWDTPVGLSLGDIGFICLCCLV